MLTRICSDCSREHSDMKRTICGTCRVRRSRKLTKDRAIEFMGGKCQNCGYDKCKRALTFHHLDPEQKDFQISQASNPSWERLKKELEKCVMLCANCHAEEHEKLDAE